MGSRLFTHLQPRFQSDAKAAGGRRMLPVVRSANPWFAIRVVMGFVLKARRPDRQGSVLFLFWRGAQPGP